MEGIQCKKEDRNLKLKNITLFTSTQKGDIKIHEKEV